MGSNAKARNELIKRYGDECFIDKLKLRPDSKKHKRYKSKKEKKRSEKLTYHHEDPKGPSSVENGALLSNENHQWFNKQSPKVQKKLNQIFDEYKKCDVNYVDSINIEKYLNLRIEYSEIIAKENKKIAIRKKVRDFFRSNDKKNSKYKDDDDER